MSFVPIAPIRCLVRHDPPDATPGIGDITLSPWNDMNVGVHHRLSRRRTIVDADVESIRLHFDHQLATNQRNQPPKVSLFFVGQVEQTGDVPLGDDERVAFCDWKFVSKCGGDAVLQVDTGCFQMAKWAAVLIH